jgi:hypothetical protein
LRDEKSLPEIYQEFHFALSEARREKRPKKRKAMAQRCLSALETIQPQMAHIHDVLTRAGSKGARSSCPSLPAGRV